jgi:hypothetical protein
VVSEEKGGEKREVRERKARDEWAPEERKQQALEATGTSYVTGRGGEREHTGRCGCHLWRKSHGEESTGTEAAEACAGMRRIGGHESRESMRLPMAAVGDLQNRGEEE